MADDDASRARTERLALIARMAAPDEGVRALADRLQTELESIDRVCEQIEAALHFSLPLDAYAQLIGAQSAAKFWAWADAHKRNPGDRRVRRQRFFTFVLMAFEIAKRERAGVTWNAYARAFEGEFFEFTKICSIAMLPEKLRPESNIALGRVLDRAGKRRTADHAPRKSRGRRPKAPAAP